MSDRLSFEVKAGYYQLRRSGVLFGYDPESGHVLVRMTHHDWTTRPKNIDVLDPGDAALVRYHEVPIRVPLVDLVVALGVDLPWLCRQLQAAHEARTREAIDHWFDKEYPEVVQDDPSPDELRLRILEQVDRLQRRIDTLQGLLPVVDPEGVDDTPGPVIQCPGPEVVPSAGGGDETAA